MVSNALESRRVAVILPVYNVATYLPECLNSLLQQTYSKFKVFAVNDGSSDESGKVLDEFASLDARIRVIHKMNGGVSSARNVALRSIEEEGGFDGVCFVDADDCVDPDFLREFVDNASLYAADCVVGGWRWFDRTGLLPNRKNEDHRPVVVDQVGMFEHFFGVGRFRELNSNSSSRFLANRYFSAELLHGVRFDERMLRAEDQDFLLRTMLRVKRGVLIPRTIYLYRVRKSSLTHSGNYLLDDMRFSCSLLSCRDVFPKLIRGYLDLFAERNWWACVRKVIQNDIFDDYKAETDAAYLLVRNIVPKSFQLRKRLFFYSLGEVFLKKFAFPKQRKSLHRQEVESRNAFD